MCIPQVHVQPGTDSLRVVTNLTSVGTIEWSVQSIVYSDEHCCKIGKGFGRYNPFILYTCNVIGANFV